MIMADPAAIGNETLTIACPAKVNLGLTVVGRREDGYHLLKMVMEPISLFDVLTLMVSPADASLVTLRCPEVSGLKTCANLVEKAAHAILNTAGERGMRPAAHFSFALKKQIPAGAGLGGGSSDAAGTLLLLNYLLSLALSEDELRSLAVGLGADVPFFLRPELCLVEGIGERLTPFPSPGFRWYVLLKPPFAIDTSWAYKKLNYKLTNSKYNINMRQFFEPDGGKKKYCLYNAFEEVVFAEFPLLGEMKQWLLDRQEARGALMSGSGSVMYAVFSDYGSAVQAMTEAETRWSDSGCRIFLAHNLL